MTPDLTASPPVLEMKSIHKAFGPTVALDGVSLELRAGEAHALVGENGAGKSTLMKILSGAQPPDAGGMRLEGAAYAPGNPLEARRAGVSMIYQELSLAPHLSVVENLFLGLERTRRGVLELKRMRRAAREAMDRAGLVSVSPDTRVVELSAAQCQQVEVARALATGCRVLVLDEPTSSLTRPDIDRLFALIRDWRRQGLAVVYISHFLEEVEEIADRCTVLCDGRVVRSAPMREWTRRDMLSAMVGREMGELYPVAGRRSEGPVLKVDLPHAAFELRRGEILGLAGLVGAGRTELLREVFGLRRGGDGSVEVNGVRAGISPRQSWRRGMGFLSEDRKREGLMLRRSVTDNLLLSRVPAWSTPRARTKRADAWLDPLRLKCDSAEDPVLSLSGGNQQKVALARLLYHGTEVLLLDEPTRGIDVGAKARIYGLLNELVAGGEGRPPRAILMVSSYLPELLGVCDRVGVMRRGRLVEIRPAAEWTEHTLMERAVQ